MASIATGLPAATAARSSGGTVVGDTSFAVTRANTVGAWNTLDVQTLGSPPENRPSPPVTTVRGRPGPAEAQPGHHEIEAVEAPVGPDSVGVGDSAG